MDSVVRRLSPTGKKLCFAIDPLDVDAPLFGLGAHLLGKGLRRRRSGRHAQLGEELGKVRVGHHGLNGAGHALHRGRRCALGNEDARPLDVVDLIYLAITGFAKVTASYLLHQPHQSVYTSIKIFFGCFLFSFVASWKVYQCIF